MQTKLGLFCDKIIEAAWLVGVMVTPILFNWYSNRVFEASKVALLRSITLVMLAAWLIKTLEKGLSGERQNRKLASVSLRTPLIAPVLFFAGAYLFSTVTSISPQISFWGSYHRRQGLYVALCYIAIFFLVLETLRTRRQLERLITVILLTSLPVSLYGIMQHYGVDPLVWIRISDTGRVESTLGNAILIGAYLIMVMPLTVWQLIRFLQLIRTAEKKVGPSVVLFGCYLLLLLLQLACLVFTQSRGPAMGFIVGVLFFFLLWAVSRRKRGLALTAVGVSIALLSILAILNLPNSPLAPSKGIPFIGRLDEVFRDIVEDRGLIWHGVVNMMTADRIRTVIGYGPETMGLVFYPYMHPDWAAMKGYQEIADRCHNETLDAWVTGGLIGLSAYLVLFSSVFYYGLKWLGLIASSRQRTFFIVAWLAGGLSGALVPWLVEGTLRWAGVGIPAGILLALVIYLLTTLFHQEKEEIRSHPNLLLIALLSALVAHFVETQFGIGVTATRTYFWTYAALLVITGYYWQGCPVGQIANLSYWEGFIAQAAAKTPFPDRARQPRGRRRRGRRQKAARRFELGALNSELLAHSLLVGLILATTSFVLITHQFELNANGPVMLGLLVVIWLFGGMTIPTLRLASGQASNFQLSISHLWTYVLGSLLCFLPFIIVHAAIVLPGSGVERATFVYYAYTFLAILAIAGALLMGHIPGSKLKAQSSNFRLRILNFGFLILSLLVLFLIYDTNLKAAQADIYYKFALSSEEEGEIDKAISVYSRAIQLAPRWSQYDASLGWAYGLKAVTTSDADQRVASFEDSVKTLERAQQMNPFDPDIIAKLGHVYWNWSSLAPDLEQKAEKLEMALVHYQQAVTLSPLNHGHLLNDDIVQTYLHLGQTYTAIDKLSQAAEAYQKANEIAPDSYEGHKNLASVYLQLGRLDEALEETKTARDLAPEDDRPGLDDLIAQLEAQEK